VALATIITAGSANGQDVTITIDKTQTYQTIDGNGFMHGIKPWKVRPDGSPFLVDADITNFLDSLINVLGMTLHRYFVDGCDLSSGPGEFAISDGMRTFFEQAQHLDSVAEENSEYYGVCPAILSPPGYMKKNGECTSGVESTYPSNPENSLKADQYDDLGDFSATFLSAVVDSFDLIPYAFSFQNEPYFNEPYSSCSYANGRHYADMLAEAGPKVRALGLPTVIYGVEHMARAYPTWERAVLGNDASAPYLDRNAVHGYTDGVELDTSSFYTLQPHGGKPLWMSETGFKNEDVWSYDGAMKIARRFMGAYRYSNMSAWIHVGLFGSAPGARYSGGFVNKENGELSDVYWVAAHYWRFLRPGMQRVESSSSNDDIWAIALKDDRVSSMSVVLLNVGETDRTVELSISGGSVPPQMDVKRTTETDKFVLVGTMDPSSETVEVPGQSIVSLGYNYVGTGTPRYDASSLTYRSVRRAAPTTSSRTVRVYDLRGRLVRQGSSFQHSAVTPSAAAYCVDNGVRRSLMITR